MLPFRQFQAGPDPAGRTWEVLFKWMQTAISLRHSDTVDVRFVLESGGERIEKTVALAHAALLETARHSGHEMNDSWCSRLAALHLLHMVTSGEDMEKDLVTVAPARLAEYAAELARQEEAEISSRRGA